MLAGEVPGPASRNCSCIRTDPAPMKRELDTVVTADSQGVLACFTHKVQSLFQFTLCPFTASKHTDRYQFPGAHRATLCLLVRVLFFRDVGPQDGSSLG